MLSHNYLLYLEKSRGGEPELIVAMHNAAGRGFALMGIGNEDLQQDFWLILRPRNAEEDIIKSLRSFPQVRDVEMVTLSSPVDTTQLPAVRRLFLKARLNSKEITDDDLAVYLNTRLRGEYGHYIDTACAFSSDGARKITIKALSDHPAFSPDWLAHPKTDIDAFPETISVDDIYTQEISSDIELDMEKIELSPDPGDAPLN